MRGALRVLALLLLLASALPCPAQSELRLTLLGTGNPRPELTRFGPSILVEAGGEALLVDCGRGAAQRLFQLDVPFARVKTVLLTHLHSDHVVGLPDFWLTGWVFGRAQPLEIVGPKGTRDLARHLERAYAFDLRIRQADEGLPAAGARLEARDIREGLVFERGGLRVTAFRVDHGPVSPALGFRVEYGGRVAVFSGDTRPSENLVKFAKGADVLVHEVLAPEVERKRARVAASAVDRVIAHHTTAEDAGRIFARVRPRLAVFSHIVPSVATEADILPDARKHYDGSMVFGEDLMRITVGEKIQVNK